MDTTKTVTHISLCAGYGGIDLGLRGAIPNLRTVAFSEIEGFACANLVSKMEAGLLDCAPIWTDLKTFPWRAFRDRVDILSGGYPCQPFSAAGKRLGTDDPRHLWPFIADGIRLLRPRICFFENVEGHISLGLREVIGELESMGYSVSWGIFSAREVGAPHQRKRVFILAMANNCGSGLQGDISRLLVSSRRQESSGSACSCCGSSGDRELANTNSAGGRQDWQSSEPRTNCIEQSSVIERRSKSGEIQEGSLWPSRPGQPQYAFEPPRVVANSASERANGGHQLCDEECGQGRALPLQSDDSGEGVGNANCFDRRTSSIGWINDTETGSAGERASVGDTEGGMPRQSSAGHWREGAGGASEGRQLGDTEEQGCGRLDDESGEAGGRETRGHADWSSNPEQQEQWQAEPTMGRNPDGTASGMDYAELCVTCDNRTDELRLLGNGVVPATATLAFQTLLAELLNL